MKKVIVIFSLVFVSLVGFSSCEGESEFDEIRMDLPTSDYLIDDEEDETGDPTGN